MKRCLVTGGAGFLGSHLSKKLIALGHQVISVDNLSTGNLQNIKELEHHQLFSFIKHDIVFPLAIEAELDWIFNLACPASPPHYQKDPIQTTKTSVIGTLNMLELAVAKKARFFQASTSEVYGSPLEHPQKESYWGNVNSAGIRSCYDEGKRCAESLCFDFNRQYDLEIKVVRIFNTYGPQMDPNDGRVVSNFIVQALQNKPLTMYGDGTQTRSFCYVDDLIEGFLAFMNSDVTIMGPINLGNPQEFTLLELAQTVKACANSSSELVFLPLPQDDPPRRKPDISLAQTLLQWHPKTEHEEGILKTMDYFKAMV